MKRILIPLIFGLAGAGVLISLGVWQVQRLAWKEAILTEIETRISAPPVALPATPDPVADKYLPVNVTGDFIGQSLRVLVSQKNIGAGYRIISAFETAGRRIMVDRGFVRVDAEGIPAPAATVDITGNLHWPQEIDSYTPAPDKARNIWFARDVGVMAQELGTEPILLVARQTSETDPLATPLPVDTAGIPNDHLNYAMTWFSLAAIWLAMTGILLWRTTQKPKGRMT